MNATDRDGDTALMFAAFKGQAAVVRLLLLHGADVQARAMNGWTAWKAARAGSHTGIAIMLKEAVAGAEAEGALRLR